MIFLDKGSNFSDNDMIDNKIAEIKEEFIVLAAVAERLLDKCISALNFGDRTSLLEIIDKDSNRIRDKEFEINSLCFNFLSDSNIDESDRQIPYMILIINKELSIIYDLIKMMSLNCIDLVDSRGNNNLSKVNKLVQQTSKMLKDSITAFIDEDVELANEIYLRRSSLNLLYNKIVEEMKKLMLSGAATLQKSINIIQLVEKLYIMSDICSKICEDAIYMNQRRVIKHHLSNDD